MPGGVPERHYRRWSTVIVEQALLNGQGSKFSWGDVKLHRQGRCRPCRLAAEPLHEVSDWVATYRRFWEQRLDGLAYTLGIIVTFMALASILLALRAGGEAVGVKLIPAPLVTHPQAGEVGVWPQLHKGAFHLASITYTDGN